jgi:hypothetical protein
MYEIRYKIGMNPWTMTIEGIMGYIKFLNSELL